MGDYEVRISSDGRPQLWVQHGQGRNGRLKERKAPELVLATIEGRTGVTILELGNWMPAAVIKRLSPSDADEAPAPVQLLSQEVQASPSRDGAAEEAATAQRRRVSYLRRPAAGITESGSDAIQAGLFSTVDETMAAFEAAAGVTLNAPVQTRGAGDRRKVVRIQAANSLTVGEQRRFDMTAVQ